MVLVVLVSCFVLFWFRLLFCFGCFGSVCFCVIFPFLFHCLTFGLLGYITPVLLFGLVWFCSFFLYLVIVIKETVNIVIVSASLVLEPVSLLFL